VTETRFLSIAILVLLVFLSTAAAVFSQTQTKVIEWAKSPIGSNGEAAQKDLQLFQQIDGVEIEEILVGGKSRFIGERFVADDDWLKAIIFRVKNLTDQRLVRLQITLVLPEMGAESPDIPFCFGCEEVEKAKGIKPGESVELKIVSGGFYAWLKSRMAEKGGVSRFTQGQIHHMFVTLPTGPTWFSGCVKTSDPKNACPHKAQ
jgi:hypothetical protein